MGGCHCSFRDCPNSSKPTEKLRYFHFPTRDPKRCLQWISNSLKPDFAVLPEDILRSKVVCQVHFEEKCFTNESKKRLVHDAIPTLHVQEPVIEVPSLEILPSSSEANVFSLGGNNMLDTSLPDCPTYFIHNGDLIPAKSSHCSKMKTSNTHSSIPLGMEEVCSVKYRTKYLPKPTVKNDYITICETENPLEIGKMSKMVKRNTKDIARLHRTMKNYILKQKILCRTAKNRNSLITQLRDVIPPSLHAIVSLHLPPHNKELNNEAMAVAKSLYKISSEVYTFLIDNCHWKLPSPEDVEKMIIHSST